MNAETIEAMQKAMAIIIAEHEVMRKCLVDKGVLMPGIPIRWAYSGQTIVNLEETIAEWLRSKENERSSDGGYVVVHLPKDITDEEIDGLTRQGLSMAMQTHQGWCCAIAGYDMDERELYQIPEAIDLCKRLCDRGFIAMMHTSTLMDKEELPQLRRFFGAMEVWAIATGNLRYDGNLEIDKETFDKFLVSLDEANQVSNLLLPKTTDGQHRTKLRL